MSTQDNARLLEQLKSSFERTTGRVTVTTKVTVNQQNRYSNFLIDPNFQQVNRFFVLLFENNGGRTSYTRYYLPLVEIKDHNAMIDGQNFFDQPIKTDLITYENIRHYTTSCLLDYLFFKNYYKIVAIDLRKQQALDAN